MIDGAARARRGPDRLPILFIVDADDAGRAATVSALSRRFGSDYRVLAADSAEAGLTLDWSFDLLSQAERALFRRLAVFVRGCALEGAEAICAGGEVVQSEVVELLTNLLDKSLVVLEHKNGSAHYTLLEPIRQDGLQRLLESGEANALQRGHAAYYGDLRAGPWQLLAELGVSTTESSSSAVSSALHS